MYTVLLIVLLPACSLGRRRFALRTPARRHVLRVHKGYPDTEGKYPYVVALLDTSDRTCTGSLIAPEWVLTAAHCLTGASPQYIQYGNMTLHPLQSLFRRKVTNTLPYPYYREDVYENDIALLKVEPALLPVYGNISASDFQALTGSAVQYAGYGSTYHSKTKNHLAVQNADKTRPLQLGDGVLVMPPKKYANYLSVAPRCDSKEQNTLSGDSGGPLLHDGKIIGVLMGEAEDSFNLFTPVSPYIQWISATIARHKENK